MVLFPLALIWVAAVLYFVIRRSTNTGPDELGTEPPGTQPRRFHRPPGPRHGRGPEHGHAGSRARRSRAAGARRSSSD